MPTNPLNTIVNVVVEVSPAAAPRSNFNEFLIIGNSTVITSTDRLRLYTSLAQMLTDGFTGTSPEYEAAQLFVENLYLYFGQGAAFNLWIGVQAAGETPLQAVQACRAKSSEWYACMVCDAVKTDHEAIDAYVATALPSTIYAFTTQDSDALAGTTGNVFETLKGTGNGRSIGQYSTSSPYAIASVMGYAMGQNTLIGNNVANSSYTLKFKQEAGVTVENVSPTQISTLEGNNANLYLSYGTFYNVFEQGVMANGQFWDEVTQLDMLANRVQLALMDLLYQNPKIPQTDAGMSQLIHAVNVECDQFVNTGFLAPGQWTGLPILNLNTGDMIPKGYLVQAPALATQSSADRSARKSVPMYLAIKEAGAVHSALITVNVNR